MSNTLAAKDQSAAFRTAVAAVVALAFLVGVAFALSACGKSSEATIRDAVAKELDAYKNEEDSAMSAIAESAEDEGLMELGIPNDQFAAAVVDGFDYRIESVEVGERDAVAKVVIVSKSLSDFESKLRASVNDFVQSDAAAKMSEQDKSQRLGEIAMETFKQTELIEEQVEFNFELIDKTWTAKDASQALSALDSLVFAG